MLSHPVEEKQRTTFISPEAKAIAGNDLTVGVLLNQIMYWSKPAKNGKSKLTVECDGHLWIAKTREQWMAETGLTERRFRRAMDVLKNRGIVEVRVMHFRYRPMLHIRLISKSIWMKHPDPFGCNIQNHLDISSNHTAPNICGINDIQPPKITAEITEVDYKGVLANAEEKHNSSIEKIEVEEKEKEEEKTSGNLPTGEEKKETETEDKSLQSGTKGLADLWMKQCRLEYKEYQEPLTAKEQGQLRQLDTYYPNDVQAIIIWVISHWQLFIQEVAIATGLDEVPASAFLDGAVRLLLEHHEVAVNLMASPDATTSSQFKSVPEGAAQFNQDNQETANDKPVE